MALKRRFSATPADVMKLVELNLKGNQRQRVPANFWHLRETRGLFFRAVALRKGISNLRDWYHVDHEFVSTCGGSYMLARYYNDSLAAALTDVYPEHTWHPWMFKQAPRRFWSDSTNCRSYLEWVSPVLGIDSMEQWYTVTAHDLRAHNGTHLMQHILAEVSHFCVNVLGAGVLFHFENSLGRVLEAAYPSHPWQNGKFIHKPRRSFVTADGQ